MSARDGRLANVQWESGRVVISLSRHLFGEETWAMFRTWCGAGGRDRNWLSAPLRVMTAEENVADYPRWKRVRVDALSWLLFRLLVPQDQKLVQLWQTIDWPAINRLCASVYKNSRVGQRAWAPAQMFALLLLYFVVPVPSESELLRTVAIVPLYRWFCGFGLFSRLPDHSTLHTFRQNLGVARFEAILSLVVYRCLKAGLIGNELVFFDMTGVAASARAWSPYERAVYLTLALLRYWQRKAGDPGLETTLPAALGQLAAEVAIECLGNKRLKKDAKAPGRILQSAERWRERQQQAKGQALWDMGLEEAVHLLLAEEDVEVEPSQTLEACYRWLKQAAQGLKARLPHTAGDHDACVGWVSNVRLICGYWLGFLVDSYQGVITAVQTVPLAVVQSTQMTEALLAHHQRVGDYPQAVAADSAQDYYTVHQALDADQIEGHIASRAYGSLATGLSLDHFTWNEQEQLCCPTGKILQPGQLHRDGRRFFTARKADCLACASREICLPKGQLADGSRRIHLDPIAHRRWQQNREHTRTQTYKRAQKLRFASEGLFGLAKRLHGADKMPYRSEPMNQIAGLMTAIAMDLVLLTRNNQAV